MVILTWAFMGLAVASAVFALLLPTYGIDHFSHEGSWQGVFHQKNMLGNIILFAMVVAMTFRAQGFVQRSWRAALFVMALAEVFLSQSRESWVAVPVVIMIYFSIKILGRFTLRDRRILTPLWGGGTLLLGGLALAYGPVLFRSLGRDATLTGRTALWFATIGQFPGHWMLGYGLNAFWTSPQAARVYAIVQWTATSAHNGYLETLLELGLVGFGFMMLIFLFAGKDAWRSLRNRDMNPSILPCLTICVLALVNIVSSLTPYPNSITWVLLILSGMMLEEDAKGVWRQRNGFRGLSER
jgi:O-antigen ligase